MLTAPRGKRARASPCFSVFSSRRRHTRSPGDWSSDVCSSDLQLDVHIHVYSSGCLEIQRMLAFRDWLRRNDDDRLLYESTKRRLAQKDWPDMNAYAQAKSAVVA